MCRYVAIGHEPQKHDNRNTRGVDSSRCGPSLARRRRPRCPNALACVAARQHNVALCKVPRCHAACKTSSPRAGAGTRRASASLRITHIHVYGRQALRAGHRVPTHPRTPRAHPCARRFGHRARLRVDTHHRFGQVIATRLHACCARLHSRVRATRPRKHPGTHAAV